MKKVKQLGIWMDHSCAIIMEISNGIIIEKTIKSEFKQEEKDHLLDKVERNNQKKDQHQQSAYYKLLGENIVNYQEVLLFGPTEAKNELFNLLKDDHHFGHIKFEIKNTDKMTEHQTHKFVTEFFA